MTWNNLLPLLILLSAMIPGILILMLSETQHRWRVALNLAGALSTIILLSFLLAGIYAGQTFETRLPLLPNIDLVLHADALSLLFAGLSAVLWLVTTFYAIGYFKNSVNLNRFFGFFSFCVSATMGVALSGNLITFVIFYELLTLTTYPLVVHKGNQDSVKAGKVYLKYTLAGGALLLAGVVWLKSLAGELAFTATGVLAELSHLDSMHLMIIFGLIILGLGVKAALVPFHGWLPIAMAAPAPVSALLHAVAVVKAGAFGIVRVVYDVYGIEFSQSLGLTYGLAAIASITIIYGSIRALYQDDLKKRLAYSTVSQVSYIVLGTAIASPLATIGGIVHLVHQGIMKITLFFCAGNLAETLHIHKVSEMNGVARKMPLTMLAFSIAALGMIGIPPIAGFVSKWYLGVGAIEAGAHWAVIVLAASSLLNAAYFLPILYAAWFKSPDSSKIENNSSESNQTSWLLLVPPLVTVTLSLGVGVFAGWIASPLDWAKLIASREYNDELVWTTLESSIFRPYFWLILVAPLLTAIGLNIKFSRQICSLVAPWIPLLAVVMALLPTGPIAELSWLFLGSKLALDPLAQNMLLLAAVLWLLGGIYARYYLQNDARKTEFFSYFLLTMCGNFGLILSQDILGFISFYTLMSLSAYGLIIHSRTDAARQAGCSYMKWTIVGEVLLFSGLVWLFYINNGEHLSSVEQLPFNHWTIGLFIAGFGIKAALLPLQFWLPKAHPVAPVPASALLSGVMVKAGLIGWLRFIPFNGEFHSDVQITWGAIVITLGFLGALVGVLAGVLQKNLKSLLAYSTISQMGIIAIAVGVGWYAPQLQPTLFAAIISYAIHHGVVKSSLFLSIGILPGLKQKGWYRSVSWVVILVPVVAMIGIPYTSGDIAKNAIKLSSQELSILGWLMPVTTVGTTILMCRFVTLIRNSELTTQPVAEHDIKLLVLMSILLGLILGSLYWLPISQSFLPSTLSLSAIWSTSWPIMLGVFIYWTLSPKITLLAGKLESAATSNERLISGQRSFAKYSRGLQQRIDHFMAYDIKRYLNAYQRCAYRQFFFKLITPRVHQDGLIAISLMSTVSALFLALLFG